MNLERPFFGDDPRSRSAAPPRAPAKADLLDFRFQFPGTPPIASGRYGAATSARFKIFTAEVNEETSGSIPPSEPSGLP